MPQGPRKPDTATSNRMRSTRRRDTSAELTVRSALHHLGYRYRVDARPEKDLRTRADIIFRRQSIAIYIDGCFWHGCTTHYTTPTTNAAWWDDKIQTNRTRDQRATRDLEARGWTVLRIWEHTPPADAVHLIIAELDKT